MYHNSKQQSEYYSKLFLSALCAFTNIIMQVQAQLLNQPPHFLPGSGDMARFSISENTPPGTPVYQLRGIDPEGSRLKYSISGPVFSVDGDTGVVRLRHELDRETQDTVEVIISITDEPLFGTEPNTVSLRRVVPVIDFNDNQPTFKGRPYTANVLESLIVGQQLNVIPKIMVMDRDEGINAELSIKCFHDVEICETFEVNVEKVSMGNYTANIMLKRPLDFESRPSYIMTLVASDGAIENRLSSFASVSINVLDVQDQPPVFMNAPYSATIAENTPGGTSVLTIKAVDGDAGKPLDIFLSLEDEPFGHFELEQFGNLMEGMAVLKTTNIPIDRESPEILQNGGVYVFNIRATEVMNGELTPDFSLTTVTIVVTDVDDHEPEFNGDFFNISLSENLAENMPLPGLSIFSDDRDMIENNGYQLSLRDVKNSANIFVVSPKEAKGRTPLVITILNSTVLDYDVTDISKREFIFDIVATVHDLEKSSTRVQVNLLDANDNDPIFLNSTYRFTARENLTINAQIGTVKAVDLDSGDFGMVMYLLKGFGSDYFNVGSTTGTVSIKNLLDYEKQNTYSLSIVAMDGGGRESSAILHIDVLDVNDNYPLFELKEYTRTIREGAENFEPQFFVRAHDIDGPTQGGGRIKHAIVSENSISGNVFRIDAETGEITLQKLARSMDTERGEYELTISATDFGLPPLTSTKNVFIRVGISGNQRPIFRGHFQSIENVPVLGPPYYRVSIPENAEPNFNVTTVTAHDPDGLDSLLRYRIVGANDNFEIDTISGLITVSPQARIDRDSNMDSFEITVNAVDSGLPIPETATTIVYVNIKDINDEKPQFELSSYAAYASEHLAVGESVLRVTALDKDLNSKLEYIIISDTIKAKSKSGVNVDNRSTYNAKEAFRIDRQTGEIFVNNTLYHNKAAIIQFMVQVTDLNAEVNREGQTDTTEITIYVQSFKDTNPVFINKGWTSSRPVVNIEIKEEMPIDSVVFILEAQDPVMKQAITYFELLDPLQIEYFQIHERTGEVILKKRLDYEALKADKTHVDFHVKAISANGQRFTVTKVNVTVQNVNDNNPIFEEARYHATVVENKVYPERVLKVKATDKDAVLTARDERLGYHLITYSLQGENAPLFEINKKTGEIVIAPNQSIDREKTPQINLEIKAEDSPGSPMDTKFSVAKLLIDVADVNDNAPMFDQYNYSTVVPENTAVDSFVLQVHANDVDDGLGGEVTYQLIEDAEIQGLLNLNSETGEIRTRRALTGKGRSEPYKLIVRAKDNGHQITKQSSLFTETDIILFIGDVSVNDGIPYFKAPRAGEIANITENARVGTVVFQVVASDPDNPNTPSGELSYKIIDDIVDARTFSIDENTGLITTLTSLDREKQDFYNIILEVMDNGRPRQSVTRILKIRVLDADDHVPRFIREIDADPLEFSIFEESSPGTVVGNFSAIDEDIGDNAAIDYVIIDGNEQNVFVINRNNQSVAIISTTQPIDREAVDFFELTIKCIKLGTNGNQFIGETYNRLDPTQLQLSIRIRDIDDNLPKFTQQTISIGIRTNVPIETVIYTVHATDADAEAKPILFSIVNVTFVPQFYKRTSATKLQKLFNLFTLNNKTGELRTGGSFAQYVDGYFELRILANNSEMSRRQAYQTVKIFVIRDKSLLKFIFARPPNEIQSIMSLFQQRMQQKLYPMGYELHLLDTLVQTKSDHSVDFSTTSSCFQLFHNGIAMPVKAMLRLMRSMELRDKLLDIYSEYNVSDVELCNARKVPTNASLVSSAGTWLVLLAALIGFAALIVSCTAYGLKGKLKRQSKHSLQALHTSAEPYGVNMGVPVFYSEPIYGPL